LTEPRARAQGQGPDARTNAPSASRPDAEVRDQGSGIGRDRGGRTTLSACVRMPSPSDPSGRRHPHPRARSCRSAPANADCQ
jgi:hypothetical protein